MKARTVILILITLLVVTASTAGEIGPGAVIAACCPLDYSEHGMPLLSDGFE